MWISIPDGEFPIRTVMPDLKKSRAVAGLSGLAKTGGLKG